MLRSPALQQGLGWIPPVSPPAALGTPGLGRVHSWCHLVALGHGKGRGSLMFIICIIIMGQYREICLREISIVSAISGPLLECETCRTTKRWELCCKVGCTEHLDVSAHQMTSRFMGRLGKTVMSRMFGMCPVL